MKTELLKLMAIMDEYAALGGMVQPQMRQVAEGDFDGVNVNALHLIDRGVFAKIDRTDIDWGALKEEVEDLRGDIEREFFE